MNKYRLAGLCFLLAGICFICRAHAEDFINPDTRTAIHILLSVEANGVEVLSIKPGGQLFIKGVDQHLNEIERKVMLELADEVRKGYGR